MRRLVLSGVLGFVGVVLLNACGGGYSSTGGSNATPTPIPFGPVQCRENADCPGGSLCFASLPGGMCVNCANDAACPAGTTCGANAAIPAASACLRACTTDTNCSLGLVCTSGTCVPVACGSGLPECSNASFRSCGNQNLCARKRCSEGCTAPTTCGAAGFCVEP